MHCCRSSRAHNRFPNLGIKQRENPQRIWLWRPVGFGYRTSPGLRKQTLGGHNKTLCAPGPRRKDQWPHKRVSQMRVSSGGGVDSRLLQGQGHWLQQSWELWNADISPFEGGHHSCHYPYHSLTSGQTTGREHSPIHQQKIGLKTYWAWHWPLGQDPVFPAASPSHQKVSTSL